MPDEERDQQQTVDNVFIPSPVLAELIKTERDYIQATGLLTPSNIQKAIDTYTANAENYVGKKYASKDQIRSFLSRVEEFSTMHASILDSFEAGKYAEGMQKVARLQGAYYEISLLIDELITKIPPEVNNSIKNETGFNSRTLDMIASLPFQRLPRYQLMFTDALKPSPEGRPKTIVETDLEVRADIEAALGTVKTIVDNINTAKKDLEQSLLMYSLVQAHLKRSNEGPESSFLRAIAFEIKEQYTNNGSVNVSDAIDIATSTYLNSTVETTEKAAKTAENLKKYYTDTLGKIKSNELKSIQNAATPPFRDNNKAKSLTSRASQLLTSFSQQKDKQKAFFATMTSSVTSKVFESSVTSTVKETDTKKAESRQDDSKHRPGHR